MARLRTPAERRARLKQSRQLLAESKGYRSYGAYRYAQDKARKANPSSSDERYAKYAYGKGRIGHKWREMTNRIPGLDYSDREAAIAFARVEDRAAHKKSRVERRKLRTQWQIGLNLSAKDHDFLQYLMGMGDTA